MQEEIIEKRKEAKRLAQKRFYEKNREQQLIYYREYYRKNSARLKELRCLKP
jgi:hypothetical protein